MQKIFIVTLGFHKQGEAPICNNHIISEASEALALDEVYRLDSSLDLIKKGYSVEASNVQALDDGCCPQNSLRSHGCLVKSDTKEPIGIYINLQVPQTPKLLADLTTLMKKHYQVTLSL